MSLGQGGSVTLRFSDNSLTGSGDAEPDLWIFESGDVVEDTFVEISSNGRDWVFVGEVTGATSSIDIDAFGFGPGDLFSFVRLTDDPTEGGGGATAGADIDAVGAIASGAVVADPESADASVGSTSPFTGAWLTDAGDQVVIFETEDGFGAASGVRNGRYFLSPTDDQLTLDGYLFEDDMAQQCQTSRDGQDRWGRLTLRLSADLSGLTAEPSICEADPAGHEIWTAIRITRTSAATPQAAMSSVLFVLSGTSGVLSEESLRLDGVASVVWFQDRPARDAGHVSVAQFVSSWDAGPSSFADDPPNATLSVLAADGPLETVVELLEVEADDASVTFRIHIIEGSPTDAPLGPASLFIDSIGPDTRCCIVGTCNDMSICP